MDFSARFKKKVEERKTSKMQNVENAKRKMQNAKY
jgi:hypothetical protein